jgi:starch-binding outer membrane protein, SusD/RagB family
MKRLNIKSIYVTVVIIMLFLSCKKSFVDVSPQGQFLTENYYKDQTHAWGALVGAYDALRKNSGGFENMVTMMNAGSDDNLAGGGHDRDGDGIQTFDNFTITPLTMPVSFWSDHYQGIFRVNTLLMKIPNTSMDATLKERYVAEAKALRGIYYFNLVRLFKNIPLILEPLNTGTMYSVTQAAPADVWTQIEKDLTEAMAVLPPTVGGNDRGRLTKGSVQAMLGKVYLYQNKNSQAAAAFADVNGTPGGVSQYGYKLLTNFADLWVFANKFNTESILEVNHSNQGNSDWTFWGSGHDEGNSVNQMVGIRTYVRTPGAPVPDYTPGWSFNVWTQQFYDVIKNDPRFPSTVFDMKAAATANYASYIEGYENTGYFLNKFMPKRSDVSPNPGSWELNFQQNSYIIRLADTYLMEAEALGGTGSRAQALLDAVRARVGLTPVPVSMAAIKAERRLELAGEGHRFFDLVRWGDAPAVLGPLGFVAGKNEILPIPFSELQGTQLQQNPNYIL